MVASPSRKSLERVPRMPSMFLAMASSPSMGRSALFPEGSPTRAVAPPTRPTGLWPQRWNHASTMIPRRLPRWRDSAVGSNPQYTLRGVEADTLPRSSLVTASRSPRERSTSTTSRSSVAPAEAGGEASVEAAAAKGRREARWGATRWGAAVALGWRPAEAKEVALLRGATAEEALATSAAAWEATPRVGACIREGRNGAALKLSITIVVVVAVVNPAGIPAGLPWRGGLF
mmetsp:Transcript_55011/g.174928  ORF Transcript_55011/g.174928 Transcript_55011/m.174928 type:complete len:231 (+) Transcript_55011:277-969(+)